MFCNCRLMFALVLATLVLLGGCRRPEPAPLDFETDPRILRGVWVGTSSGTQERLELDLEASSPSLAGYTVNGTFQFEDDAAVPFSMTVHVPVTASASATEAQTDIPCYFLADLAGARGQDWELCGNSEPGLTPLQFELIAYNRDDSLPNGVVAYNAAMYKQADMDN